MLYVKATALMFLAGSALAAPVADIEARQRPGWANQGPGPSDAVVTVTEFAGASGTPPQQGPGRHWHEMSGGAPWAQQPAATPTPSVSPNSSSNNEVTSGDNSPDTEDSTSGPEDSIPGGNDNFPGGDNTSASPSSTTAAGGWPQGGPPTGGSPSQASGQPGGHRRPHPTQTGSGSGSPSSSPISSGSSSSSSGSPSTGGGASGNQYVDAINVQRKKMNKPALTYSSKLESNVNECVTAGNGQMVHKLNPGTMGQVLAPATCDMTGFNNALVNGWICEIPSLLPAGSCTGGGYSHDGETGHAQILSNAGYKNAACACVKGIWGCDFS